MNDTFTSPTGAEALMQTGPRPNLVVARGEGSYLFDEAGRRYLDFVQGWAVNALGHRPAVVVEAIARQAQLLLNAGPAFHTRSQLALASELVDAGALDRVFLCSTGAEANEGAIKLARKWAQLHRPGAFEIITTDNAFHGRTLATMAATGKPGWDALFPPVMPGFVKTPYGDVTALDQAIGPQTAAVMIEPIQGEAGVVVPPAGYVAAVRELCDARGVLLILDEVQTGVGRTGTLFRFEAEGVRPDILTLGKGLGGGVPLAALAAREEVCCFAPGDQGGTFAGNALMAAAGQAVIEVVRAPAFLEGVRARGEALGAGLEDLAKRHGHAGQRGAGLLRAMVLSRPIAADVAADCLARGLLINAPRPDVLRFMPALDVPTAAIGEALGCLDEVLGGR